MKNLLVCLLAFAFLSCSKKQKETIAAETLFPAKEEITLEEATIAGCFNLALYFSGFQSLNPQMEVFEVSTGLELQSERSIRENYHQLLAYSTFRYGNRSAGSFHEFAGAVQEDCRSLALTYPDGREERYTITEASADRLTALSENGRELAYHWLSPKSVEVRVRYIAYDLPCGKEDPIFVRYTRRLDWDQRQSPEIEPAYLAKVAEATGADPSQLTTPVSLQNLAQLPLRPEILTCAGHLPDPEPIPEEPEEVPDPEEDEG